MIEKGPNIYNSEKKELNNKRVEKELENKSTDDYERNLGLAKKKIDLYLDKFYKNNNKETIDSIIFDLENNESDRYYLSNEEIDRIIKTIKELKDVDCNKEELFDNIREIFIPVTKSIAARYNEIEAEEAEYFNKKEGFIKINRVLSYGGTHDTIHLHHPPARTIPKEERSLLYIDGFRKLAKILESKDKMKYVTVSGPLAFRKKELLSRAGFDIEEMSDDLRERHFKGSKKEEVIMAKISRDKFLEIYLDKN